MKKADKELKDQQKQKFSYRLRLAMDKKNMKATDLSTATGIDKGAISNYVNGRFMPKQDKLYLLASVLDVAPAWLGAMDILSGMDMPDPTAGLGGFSVPLSLAFPEDDDLPIVSNEPWDADAAFSEEDASNIRILARGMMNISPENRKQLLDVARALFKNDFDDEGNKR